MELMTRRRAILAQPHEAAESGSHVTFSSFINGTMEVSGVGNITSCGKNLFDEVYPDLSNTTQYRAIYVGNSTVTMSSTVAKYGGTAAPLFLLPGNVTGGASTNENGVWAGQPRTTTSVNGYITIGYRYTREDAINPSKNKTMIEVGTSATQYEKYHGATGSAGTRAQFHGINNVWSDDGNVTVKYWTH